MALCLCDSLIENNKFQVCSAASKYLEWYSAEGFDTGPTASVVFDDLIRAKSSIPYDKDWLSEEMICRASESAHHRLHERTAGCNAAHRCPPIAMLHTIPDKELVACATADATITHQHRLAGEAAAATVLLCRLLIRGISWDLAVAQTRSAKTWSPEIDTVLSPAASRLELLSRGGFAPEALRAAIYFAGAGASFEAALTGALGFAGPDNYCPVLVGALAGARWGAAAVPPDMLEHRMARGVRERVASAAARLAAGWGAE